MIKEWSLGILINTVIIDVEQNLQVKEQIKSSEIEKSNSGSKIKRVIPFVIVLFSIGLVSAFFYARYINYLTGIPEVQVPNVVGLDKNDAIDVLEMHKLKAIIKGEKVSKGTSSNLVLETYPESGRIVKAGRTVMFVVSKGKGQVYLSDLSGLSVTQAKELLTEKGLSLENIGGEYSVKYKEGIVIDQYPTANTYIKPDVAVKVILSKGFPVEIKVEPTKQGIDKQKVKVKIFTLGDEGEMTNIKVVVNTYGLEDGREIKFYDNIAAGKEINLEFEEPIGNSVEVYYDDVLAKIGKVLFK